MDRISPGGTTYLWASWTGSSATVDNGVGPIGNALAIDVSPISTTTYTLTVSNSAGATTTATVTVIVDSPTTTTTTTTVPPTTSTTSTTTTSTTTTAPQVANDVTISSQPVSQTVVLGNTANLSVTAEGTGSLSYQWTLDGVDIPGAAQRTYSTTTEGTYAVKVTSTVGASTFTRISSGAVVTVNAGTITSEPVGATITDGAITYLTVGWSAPGSLATQFQWLRNGTEISGANTTGYGARIAGTYRLRITTTNNGVSRTQYTTNVDVIVVAPPVITSFTASSATILLGNSTDLVPIFSGGTASVSPGVATPASGASVSVSPVASTTYTLTVTNAAGTSLTQTVAVTVTTGTLAASANNSSTSRYRGSSSILLTSGNVLVIGADFYGTTITDEYNPTTNRFTQVGSMIQSRGNVNGIRLANGKVLVAGGSYYTGTKYSARSTAELYDPATQTWSYTGSLSTGRRDNFAVLLANGKVLIGGGRDANDNVLSSVEIYDLGSGHFSAAAPMPGARESASATVMANGNVLVAGGSAGGPGLDTAAVYDVTADSWTTLTSHLNYGRYGAKSVLLTDGRVLIVGGRYTSVGETHLEIFDPATSAFVHAWDLPALDRGREGMTVHVLANGNVAIFGGNDGYGDDLNDIVVYDPGSNSLTTEATTLSVTRYLHSSVVMADGRVFLLGGNYWNNSNADIFTP